MMSTTNYYSTTNYADKRIMMSTTNYADKRIMMSTTNYGPINELLTLVQRITRWIIELDNSFLIRLSASWLYSAQPMS
ncbi:MAG: hypothetical protein DRR08_04610 [Candidatus Parabeggiatoa sp. nov. 2]|nr:MAG: hypothetical protein DRR08_04610 [Gammaproteobacteria bacterium]